MKNITQMEARLATSDGVEKINLLNEICFQLRFSNPPWSAELIEQTEVLLQQHPDYQFGKVMHLINQGTHLFFRGQHDSGISNLHTAVQMCQEYDIKHILARSLFYLGYFNTFTSDHASGLTILLEALNLVQSLDLKLEKAMVLEYVGVNHGMAGLLDQSLAELRQALSIYREVGNTYGIASALNNLAHAYSVQSKYQEALDFAQQSLSIAQQNQIHNLEITTLESIARAYHMLNESTKALEAISQSHATAVRLMEMGVYGHTVAQSYYYNGRILLDQKQVDKALEMLNQGVIFAQKCGARQIEFSDHKLLASAYEQQGNYRKALVHYKQFHTLKEEIFNEESARRLNNLRHSQEIREMERAKQVAEAASLAKSSFMANMSHELRSPLNSILGFSNLLRRDVLNGQLPATQSQNESINLIYRSGEHLLTLINNVLDLSKIESGRTVLHPNDFDLHRMLDDLEDMYGMRAEGKGLSLQFERAANLPRFIHTDEVKLRQVMINLLGNALKFTEKGGVIVRVLPVSQPDGETTAEATAVTSTRRLLFEVIDTGPGIEAAEMSQLFVAFSQTKAGQQAKEGTGLGLAISRQFVQLMGGDITAESEGGQGSLFRFEIAATIAEASAIEARIPDRQVVGLAPGQAAYRILIVDDEESNRQLLIELLQPLGFVLRVAANGQEAVDIWQAWRPHLIWMDMRMPVLDGYEATQRIKGVAIQNEETKILAMTASTFEEERGLVLDAGCDDFMRKPFRESELLAMMGKHLGVEYVYAEDDALFLDSDPDIAQALAALPIELLTRLEAAAVRSDMAGVDVLIEEVKELDTAVAETIAKLADKFEYPKILTLLERNRETKREKNEK